MSRGPAAGRGTAEPRSGTAPAGSTGDEPPSGRGRRRLLDVAIALGLLAIAVAAIVNVIASDPEQEPVRADAVTATVREDPGPAPTVTDGLPEELPQLLTLPGELREEGGMLWWSGVDCLSRSLELGSGAVTTIAGEHCRVWPAPGADAAVALGPRRVDTLGGRGLEYLDKPAGNQRVLSHTPGVIGSEVAWSPDGSRFAVCLGTRDGTVVDVRDPVQGTGSSFAGACFPAWLGDGRLVLTAGDRVSIRAGGRVLFRPAQAAEILPSVPKAAHRAVSALAGQGDRLAVALAVVSPMTLLPASSAVAVLRGGAVEFQARLRARTLPAAVGLAPAGDALWYLDASKGHVALLAVPGGRRLLPSLQARWLAWSPDGRYLAAAGAEGIRILRWPDGEEVATVPVDASAVAWSGS